MSDSAIQNKMTSRPRVSPFVIISMITSCLMAASAHLSAAPPDSPNIEKLRTVYNDSKSKKEQESTRHIRKDSARDANPDLNDSNNPRYGTHNMYAGILINYNHDD